MKHRQVWLLGLLVALGGLTARPAAGQTDPAPLEARLQAGADGRVSVLFRGVPGALYRIESSETWEAPQWAVAAESVEAGGGWTEWIDPASAGAAQRLYRVLPRETASVPPPVLATNVLAGEVGAELRFLADSNTVQAALAAASDAWARIQEAGDAGKLVGALGAGNDDGALAVLRDYGVAEGTLTNMAARLREKPRRTALAEKFVRGVVGLPMNSASDKLRADFKTAAAQGRERPYWVVKSLGPDWGSQYDRELAHFATPPIAVLDARLQEVDFIRFFQWYDRYADRVHSVLLNSENLSNWDLKTRYDDANLVMAGMYRLIKARKPDAFVWARVVWQEDESDARWLKALSFQPDGIVVWNLHSFLSPFDRARLKYAPIVGEDTPMLVAEFFGFWPQVTTVSDLKAMGRILDANLDRFEERMRQWGYRGLIADWRAVQAIDQARR